MERRDARPAGPARPGPWTSYEFKRRRGLVERTAGAPGRGGRAARAPVLGEPSEVLLPTDRDACSDTVGEARRLSDRSRGGRQAGSKFLPAPPVVVPGEVSDCSTAAGGRHRAAVRAKGPTSGTGVAHPAEIRELLEAGKDRAPACRCTTPACIPRRGTRIRTRGGTPAVERVGAAAGCDLRGAITGPGERSAETLPGGASEAARRTARDHGRHLESRRCAGDPARHEPMGRRFFGPRWQGGTLGLARDGPSGDLGPAVAGRARTGRVSPPGSRRVHRSRTSTG